MPRSPRRGEIYRQKSDPVGKQRPVLVVSRNELHGGVYLLAIPFYGSQVNQKSKHPTAVQFSDGEFGLDKDCVTKGDQITQFRMGDLTISDGPIGTLDSERMAQVDRSIAYALNLSLATEPTAVPSPHLQQAAASPAS